MNVCDLLFQLRDERYALFQHPLIPTVDAERFIGVRTPLLRNLAKQMMREGNATLFVSNLPHRYFDENQLHAFIISEIKDFDACLHELERFLPFVDNWATCDQLSPRCFMRHHSELLHFALSWLESDHEYTVRFGIKMLMQHFLDDDFSTDYLQRVARIHRDEYYIQMMQAWFFATALAKRYDATVPLLENPCLDPWTHNKAIQKATESFRVSDEHKAYLRTLKIR